MFLNVLIDVILVALFLLGIFFGWKRGFVRTVAWPVKLFASFAVAFSFAERFGRALIYPIIYSPIANKVADSLLERCGHITAETVSELPTLVRFSAFVCGVDVGKVAAESGTEGVAAAISDAIAGPMVGIVATIIGFIILYFGTKLVLNIVIGLVSRLFDGGIIGKLNRTLGIIFSALFAFVICWFLVLSFDFLLHTSFMVEREWVRSFNGGPIFRLLRELDPLDMLLSF